MAETKVKETQVAAEEVVEKKTTKKRTKKAADETKAVKKTTKKATKKPSEKEEKPEVIQYGPADRTEAIAKSQKLRAEGHSVALRLKKEAR